jgi:signal transduction histidine kinase/ActR/RegA family two-component response regulator
MSWVAAIHPEDRARVEQAARTQQASRSYDVEYRIVRPDGAVRWIHDRAFPVHDASGQVSRVAGVATDITARHELEQQVRQAQKMEAVGQLAGGIAHDFNNLLVVIELHATSLEETLELPPEARESLQQIVAASERAATLTKQLLTFSRRAVPQVKETDLGAVTADMSKLLQRVLGEDVSLETHLGAALPSVMVDAGMMEQVLMNLAVNARDAMPRGGRLIVALEAVELRQPHSEGHPLGRPGSFVCLSVRDTGTGIPEEHRARIFEPFFTTKEVGRGTGLGLATVFGIVEEHHGWIEVDSELGVGTTFRIYLPAQASTLVPEVVPVEVSPAPRGVETVLLVEDDPMVRRVARRTLERSGYRVFEAESGPAAIERWRLLPGKVDLLLTDLVMPEGMSGGEVASRMRELQPGIKVLYMSGYSKDVVSRRLSLTSGQELLEKPFTASALAHAVRRRLDQA